MVIETSISISRQVRLKFQLAKNKYEIKHNRIIHTNEFLALILERYEKMDL